MASKYMTISGHLCYLPPPTLREVFSARVRTERCWILWKSHVQWNGKCLFCVVIGICEFI